MQRISVLFAVLIAFCSIGFAGSGELLTNEGIITLAKNGALNDDVRIMMIKSATETDFTITPEAISDLAAAGVSNAVITAMLERYTSKNAKPATAVQRHEKSLQATLERVDKWNDLYLGVSTLAEVRAKLGQPAKEETTDLKSYKVGPAFLGNVRKEKVFLTLTYRPDKNKSEAYREIIAFLKDDVLVALVLDPSKDARQDPQGLINYFEGVQFHDFVNGWEEGSSKGTGRYERLGDEVTVNNYGMDYAVWGKSDKTLVVLEVRQPKRNFVKEIGTGIFDKTDRRRPGKVHRIYYYSRDLEPKASLAQN